MSNNQNDKDFPTINIDMDEHRPIERKTSGKNSAGDSDSQVAVKKSGNAFGTIAFIFAVAALGINVFLYKQLEVDQQRASAAENRILSLEDKISATGEEIGNSTVALQVKVTELTNKSNELWDQMDKLWASAWRRNQQDIKSLDGQVKKIQTDTQQLLSGIDKKASEAQTSTQALISRVDGINGKLNNQANDILAASVSAEQASETARAQSTRIEALNEKIMLLEKRNSDLLSKIADLETQLRELATKTVSNQQVNNDALSLRTDTAD
jgi:chromosome segregation ATPase